MVIIGDLPVLNVASVPNHKAVVATNMAHASNKALEMQDSRSLAAASLLRCLESSHLVR